MTFTVLGAVAELERVPATLLFLVMNHVERKINKALADVEVIH